MDTGKEPTWGVRLADVRVPRYWWVSVLGGLLLARRRQTRDLREAVDSATELAEVIADRWQQNDARERRLERLTLALLAVALATVGVTIVALVAG